MSALVFIYMVFIKGQKPWNEGLKGMQIPWNKKDRTGENFGRLAVKELHHTEGGRSYWLCVCVCGKEKIILTANLSRTFSCGCLRNERIAAIKTTHGLTKINTYKIWAGLKTRCYNIKAISYRYYGARGIKVCKRWQKFENFLTDMGERPANRSIDRIDNDGDYEPSNCRWATAKQQANNKRQRSAKEVRVG